MHLTLAVDALSPHLSGIGRYTWELSQKLPLEDEIDGVLYYYSGRLIDDPRTLLDHVEWPRRSRLRRSLDNWRTQRKVKGSLFHGPNYFLPASVDQGVITVHDLSVFRYPDTHPAARVAAFGRYFTQSIERATLIITDSETVRHELASDFNVDLARIRSVPLGVDSRYQPSAVGDGATLLSYGLTKGQYALCVSTLEPRKQIPALLDAWEMLPNAARTRYPLVLVGGVGWSNGAIMERIKIAQAQGWLLPIGYVDETTLPALYAGAALFLYPSLYEGFGLPPVEAMACGVPVIVSPTSCLPEVCGDAAAYADPREIDGYAEAICKALEDDSWRQTARQLGFGIASKLTWQKCVEETAAAYRYALSI